MTSIAGKALDIYLEAIAAGAGDSPPWTDEYRKLTEPFLRDMMIDQFETMEALGLLTLPNDEEERW